MKHFNFLSSINFSSTLVIFLLVLILVTSISNNSFGQIPDFRIGLQMVDAGGKSELGQTKYSNWASEGGTQWSEIASDDNKYDPDGMRIHLEIHPSATFNKDFRIGILAYDSGDTGKYPLPKRQFTPWFSEGGGWSGWAYDGNKYDPDGFQVIIETRPLPSNTTIDTEYFKVYLQATDEEDKERGEEAVAVWHNQYYKKGMVSNWAFDANKRDPDAFRIGLEWKYNINN